MGWRRNLVEALLPIVTAGTPSTSQPPADPESIFVLRNNDIGDLLVVTPLFEALGRRFPKTRIIAGIGDWNRPVLEHNPWVSEVVSINAPWHNKAIKDQSLGAVLRYLRTSDEVTQLRALRPSIGIDVLGSQWGAWLMSRAGIPYRVGVHGYAGGHSVMQANVTYRPEEHVGRSALRFAEILGATDLPPVRPQVFLTDAERAEAEARWASTPRGRRVLIAPGGGFASKCWPPESYAALVAGIRQHDAADPVVVGGPMDKAAGQLLAAAGARDWTGQLSLRQTFAAIACSDFVIANGSMVMHVAAAFEIPSVIMLGEYFESADAHAAQWGYPGNWCNLGRDAGHPVIFTPSEALDVVIPTLKDLK